MTTTTTTERPCRRNDVLTENLPDGTSLVFDPRTELAHPLTASAAIIWEHCDGRHTVADIVRKLSEVYDASEDVIARDIGLLLDQLGKVGLLDDDAKAAEGGS